MDFIVEQEPDKEDIPKHLTMSKKQYFRVNLSKFMVELIGTFIIGLLYQLLGDKQIGMFLGIWIITIFGSRISGAHFNPAVTIAQTFRSGKTKLESKLLGVIYIAG